jgi:hypothetical protein
MLIFVPNALPSVNKFYQNHTKIKAGQANNLSRFDLNQNCYKSFKKTWIIK